jgi:hypothetical protein
MKESPNDRRKVDSFPKSSLEQPDSTGLVIHLHTPSKEFLETQTLPPQHPLAPIDPALLPSETDSSSTITHETNDRADSRQESAIKRALSNPFKREKVKKPSVEDILAMRQLQEFGKQEPLVYPGVQPVILSGRSRVVYDV